MTRPALTVVLLSTCLVFPCVAPAATEPRGSTPFGAAYATAWQAFGDLDGGCDRRVTTMRRAPDGDLYLAGDFESCNGVVSRRLIRYSPAEESFHAIEPALESGFVSDIAWYQGQLHVAGDGLASQGVYGGLLRWDGSAWHRVGSNGGAPLDLANVVALQVHEGSLVAAGVFLTAGGQPATNIARWNGSAWSAMGEGLGFPWGGSRLDALAVHDGALVAGGRFHSSGNSSGFGHVARWDGAQWQPMGAPGGNVGALKVDDNGNLLVAGALAAAGAGITQVKRWTGSEWAPMAPDDWTGFDGAVRTLEIHQGEVVAGGDFTAFGSTPASSLARWTGTTWEAYPVDAAVSPGMVLAVLSDGSFLYVAGALESLSGRGLHHVARVEGEAWQRLGLGTGGLGLDGGVAAFASDDHRLAVSGVFRRAGDRAAHGVAFWEGQQWQRLDRGGPTPLWGAHALAFYQGELYAAAAFYDGEWSDPAWVGVGRWRGDGWEPVVDDSGQSIVGGQVRALMQFDGELVVGGEFTISGELGELGIARWNGQRWATLQDSNGVGLPQNAQVHALAVHAGRLVAGGRFYDVGGTPASGLAFWGNGGWTAVKSSPDHEAPVSALAVWNGDLHVGGYRRLSRLQGNTWQPLVGTGLQWDIRALAGLRDALWIGGEFASLDGVPAVGLVRFDGSAFHPVAGDIGPHAGFGPGKVHALAVHQGELMVGGLFDSVGGQRSAHIARLLPDVVAGVDMHVRAPFDEPDVANHRVAYRVRLGNRGHAAAVPATLELTAWPQPLAIAWSCQASAFSSEPCPAEGGIGLPSWTTAMAPGAEFHLDLHLDAAPETLVQRVRLDLSAPPIPGTLNRPSAGLTVTTALAAEVLLVDGFESATNR